MVAALRNAPAAASVSTYRRCRVQITVADSDSEVELVGLEPSPAILAAFLRMGNADAAAGEALLRGEAAFVSEPLAFRHALQVGSQLRVHTSHGSTNVPVAAIYRDYSNERGEVLVGAAFCERHLPVAITAVALEAANGIDVEQWAIRLRELVAGVSDQMVQVRTQGELRRTSLEIFDRTFAITSAMRLLCLMVAFFGIYAAFSSLQLERGREIGVLRCLGARPRRIAGLVLGQTALLGAAAGLLALPVGALLGQVLARIINRISFGWSLSMVEVPLSAMFEVLWLAIAAALLAGLQPALRFARMRPVEALRES
jgi:putative ABC transport system permease protein